MRELPIMEIVEDTSLESVLAVIFHYITELIRRVEIVQRVGSICAFHEVRLPSDVASRLALSFGPIRWTPRIRKIIISACEGFEKMLHLWRAMCKTARPMPRSASPMHALDRHAPRRSLYFLPS